MNSEHVGVAAISIRGDFRLALDGSGNTLSTLYFCSACSSVCAMQNSLRTSPPLQSHGSGIVALHYHHWWNINATQFEFNGENKMEKLLVLNVSNKQQIIKCGRMGKCRTPIRCESLRPHKYLPTECRQVVYRLKNCPGNFHIMNLMNDKLVTLLIAVYFCLLLPACVFSVDFCMKWWDKL